MDAVRICRFGIMREMRVAGGRRNRRHANAVAPRIGACSTGSGIGNCQAGVVYTWSSIFMPWSKENRRIAVAEGPVIMRSGSVRCRRIEMNAIRIVRLRIMREMRIAGRRRNCRNANAVAPGVGTGSAIRGIGYRQAGVVHAGT